MAVEDQIRENILERSKQTSHQYSKAVRPTEISAEIDGATAELVVEVFKAMLSDGSAGGRIDDTTGDTFLSISSYYDPFRS